MKNQPESTGLLAPGEEHDKGPVGQRPLSAEWITEDLLAHTRKVWSKIYGRVISSNEAVEILMNVKRLAEVLMEAEQKDELS